MNITTSVFVTALTVTAAKLINGEMPTMKMVVGGGFLLFGLAVLSNINGKFASAFATLIMVAALLRYGPVIAKAVK